MATDMLEKIVNPGDNTFSNTHNKPVPMPRQALLQYITDKVSIKDTLLI
jgi:hypothetical protein